MNPLALLGLVMLAGGGAAAYFIFRGGGVTETEVVGQNPDGSLIVLMSDGTTRSRFPKPGEVY